MKILITRDTMSDIYLDALRIRHEVFVDEQNVPLDFEVDKDEAYSIHFVLYITEHQPVATVRLLPLEETIVKLQRMAVLPNYRGQHYGEKLIDEVERFAKEQEFATIELSAQLTSEGFYKKLGYQSYGEVFLDANIDHIHMRKDL